MHDVGNFWLEITNFGMFGGDNDKFTHDEFFISAEYPARSGINHICGGGLWVGAIIDTSSVPGVTKKIKKVSFGYEGWGGDGHSQGAGTYELIEMWPSSKPADTIWVISKDHPEQPAGWDGFCRVEVAVTVL